MTERMTLEEYHALKKRGKPRDAKKDFAQLQRTLAFEHLKSKLEKAGHTLIEEYRFHPTRKYRFDLAIMGPKIKIALEIDGGGWVGGAHHRKQRRDSDCEKDTLAMELGWRVIRRSWDKVISGEALEAITAVIAAGEE